MNRTITAAMAAALLLCSIPSLPVHADGSTGPRMEEQELIGNRNTKKVHRVDCRYARTTSDKNRVGFNSYGEAVRAGYKPCKTCRPDTTVSPGSASLIPLNGVHTEDGGAPRFVGQANTRKVHLLDCPHALKIGKDNRIFFNRYDRAARVGFAPCKDCKPDERAPAGETASRKSVEPGAGQAGGEPFIGHSGSKKIHTASCRYARNMAPDKRVPFGSFSEAAGAGYIPCKVCKPGEAAPAPAAALPARDKVSPPAVKGFVGSKKGKTFHRPECDWVRRIAPHNIVRYTTHDNASAAGRKPCVICNP